MARIPKINESHGSETYNIINRVIEVLNQLGVNVQDLVAEGQLTPEQYAELITVINGHLKSGGVTVADLDKNNFKLDGTFFSQQFLKDLADAEINTTNVLPKSVTKRELADRAVPPEKTGFMKIPNNMINKSKLIIGKSLVTTTGEIIDNPNHAVTPFIEIEPGKTYTIKDAFRYFLYEDDKSFISSNVNKTYTMSSPIKYIRLTMPKNQIDTAQLNEGTEIKPYDDGYYKMGTDEYPVFVEIPEKSVGKNELIDDSVESRHMTIIKKSRNMINKKTNKTDTFVNYDTGQERQEPGHFSTDFIEVEPGETYTLENVYRWVLYDIEKKYINSVTSETYTMPATVHFVRVTGLDEWEDSAQIVKGAEKLPYEPYGEYIDPEFLPQDIREDDETFDWINEHQYVIDGELDGYYEIDTLESKSDDSNDPLKDYDIYDFYQLFDDLMDEFPEIISRNLEGNDESDTYPIYSYHVKLPKPDRHGSWNNIKENKAILVAGSHPEKQGIYSLFKAIEEIVRNPNDSPLIDTLRNNMHFIVVPIWAPWNVENGTRWNVNKVNVGRNFPEKFVVLDESDSAYGGTEPLSEKESQYLHKIMVDNADALYHIDFHNFFATTVFLWASTRSDAMANVGEKHIMKMTSEWKRKYPEIVNNQNYVGYTTARGNPDGNNHTFAESLGIRALTYEVSQQAYFEEGAPRHSALVNTLGTEAFINFLLAITKYTVNEKNLRN